jgi:hypothetical protein
MGLANAITGSPGTAGQVWTSNGASSPASFQTNPSFFAYVPAQINNVTGNGTEYTVVFGTEISDVGGGYDVATGIFTAPEDGVYSFSAGVAIINASTATSYKLGIINSARSVSYVSVPSKIFNTDSDSVWNEVPCTVQLTAGQTARVVIVCSGVGADTVDVAGLDGSGGLFAGAAQAFFCGGKIS